jgi:peptidoglycan-associated lipoprotein
MKKYHSPLLPLLSCLLLCVAVSSCKKRSSSQWDQTPVTSRFPSGSTLWDQDSEGLNEFTSLKEDDLSLQYTDGVYPQPAYSPGEPGSSIPSLDYFYNPTGELAQLFKNIYFSTDSFTIKESDYKHLIAQIGAYLHDHPTTYVAIEGFCDERGAEAYNLSLGAKRANSVRSQLIKKGAHPDQIHTISFGKEQPVDIRHTQEAWAKNRRTEFKLYQK